MVDDTRPDWLAKYGDSGMPDIPDRWAAMTVLPDLDYEAQLAAIRDLLGRNRNAEDALSQTIEEIKEIASNSSGVWNERAVDELIGHYEEGTYQDAANSMSAVGMIAPFVESLFFQAFANIGREFFPDERKPNQHERWESEPQRWDCHWVRRGQKWSKDVVAGITQLADASGLRAKLPDELEKTLAALFAYRNKMFHFGMEWPQEERVKFGERIRSEAWPTHWFQQSTRGEEVWIHYMTSAFTDHCLQVVNDCIEGIGAYCKEQRT